ncbi:MAG: DUF2726 domain-containing protein [Burkholderiales bacterium]
MVALWYLLVLAPFIAIPILWWNYRRRQAAREQVVGARWQSLVKEAVASPAGSAAEPQPAAAVVAAPVPAAAAHYAPAERVLDPAQTVLYYLLKNCLSDHEIMPRVTLGSLLSVPAAVVGSEREQRQRLLARETVDFLVCDKAMKPVAVIDLLAQEAPAALTTAPDFKSRCLAQSGIRHLCLVRTSLPRRDELRGLVLGA